MKLIWIDGKVLNLLDHNGFKRKTYSEIVDEMEDMSREKFGEDINTSSRTPLGVIIRIVAWFLSKIWELAEKVYNSAFVTKAEGVQLDYLTPFFNTSRMPEQEAHVPLTFKGTPFYVIEEGTRFETESGIDFALTEDVILDSEGEGSGIAYCLSVGDVGNVPANTIVVQSEPSEDVFSVTNVESAQGGRDRETHPELKERLLNSGAGAGSATTNAILAAVLGVPGVRTADIKVNKTMEYVDGMPPKSFQVFALGGLGKSITEAIFDKMAGGIESFGTTEFTVKDISGNDHIVCYTPASTVDIYVSIKVVVDSTFETNGVTEIKNEVIRYIGGATSDGTSYPGLSMAQDVIRFQVEKAVGDVPGVIDVSAEIGKTANAVSTGNVEINNGEVAQTNTEWINVVIS